MISIGLDHTASLFPNPSDAFLIPRGIQFAGPKREFGLEIDSLLVCGGEAGVGGGSRSGSACGSDPTV